MSALLGFMASSGILGWLNIKAVEATVYPPDEIYAGAAADFRIVVDNRSRRPLFLLNVRCHGTQFPFFTIPAGSSASASRPIVLHGRGEHVIGRVDVLSSFPVGFFIRSISWNNDGPVVVFPAPRSCSGHTPDGDAAAAGSSSALRRGFEGEVTGIAGYTGSEPMKSVHWRLSARHDNLKVKQIADAASPPVIVDPADLPGASLEERLSCGAYIINAGIAAGRSVGLVAGRQVFPPGVSRSHRLRLLAELARYA